MLMCHSAISHASHFTFKESKTESVKNKLPSNSEAPKIDDKMETKASEVNKVELRSIETKPLSRIDVDKEKEVKSVETKLASTSGSLDHEEETKDFEVETHPSDSKHNHLLLWAGVIISTAAIIILTCKK